MHTSQAKKLSEVAFHGNMSLIMSKIVNPKTDESVNMIKLEVYSVKESTALV